MRCLAQAARKNIMKHTFKIIYETDGMPICPDAIHKQLDLAMDDIKKQFSIQYYTLPGLHKLYLEPCGDWFPEEQKPIRFELQAPSGRVGPRAPSRKLDNKSRMM